MVRGDQGGTMDSKDWAKKEFEIVDLGDDRLNQRLVKISQHFLDSPESPINKACGDWGETKAAYRFFDNDKINYQDIIQAHAKMAAIRSRQETIVLAIQDTTYYNYTNHPETKGLGVLSRFKGKHKDEILTKGLCMHTTLGITPEGLPLGILDQNIYSRKELPAEKMALKKRTHNVALSIEEKESIRWLDSMKKTASLFEGQPKRVVTIADREADIYDLFHLADRMNVQFLVRASQNRKINKAAIYSDNSGEMLWDFMKKKKRQGTIQVSVPKKDNQPARLANCNIKFEKASILPPRNHRGSKKGNLNLTVFVIHVVEKNPPSGAVKIEWMLYTNIPVLNFQDAVEKIKWYCLRWRIEVYFKVIKSGFKVEDCRLENADRLIRYLAVVSIVAWRVYWLTLVSRTAPNTSALLGLSDFDWKVLFMKFNPNQKIPKRAPCMKQATIWIAQLGGFLARKNDGDPGITHIWRGLRKLADMIEGARLLRNTYG
jgi:hypothetical protein